MTPLTVVNMWCGPSTVSTALMYSWRQRSDTLVFDDPFYGVDLREHDPGHPGRDEIIQAMPADAAAAIAAIQADAPEPVRFVKNIGHHLGVEYHDAMLSWPAGPKPEDRVWAEHGTPLPTARPASTPRPPRTSCSPTASGPWSPSAGPCTNGCSSTTWACEAGRTTPTHTTGRAGTLGSRALRGSAGRDPLSRS